ncbi:MAG: FAD-dependent oxidoreductase [Deltaproteobacteria bacterium]|nr:FAD-dependent oxidoreductase [Deltaproteobacteria bacterium]
MSSRNVAALNASHLARSEGQVVGCVIAAVFFAGLALGLPVLIRRRLHSYRVVVVRPDPAKPERPTKPVSVGVVGGGLAGIAAAEALARRGVAVTLFEAQPYLGGKLGAWTVDVAGESVWVSHGFHAFFDHYYNLNRFLDRLGLRARHRSIGEYVVIARNGERLRFGRRREAPGLNLLALAARGAFPVAPVLRAPLRDLMGLFLEYDPTRTHRELDHLSLADLDAVAPLPRGLKTAFNTFARAFFAHESELSLAELVKSFHFYYLSHDRGLIYGYPADEYERSLLLPIRSHLQALGVRLRLNTPVAQLERAGTLRINGEAFDQVVLAADAAATKQIMDGAQGLPSLFPDRSALRAGRPYAVLRLWTDRDIPADLPGFVITDRHTLLDAVAAVHRLEADSRRWVDRHGGAVLELHCYAVPDGFDEASIRAQLIAEAGLIFPALQGLAIRAEHLQLKRDFTAFHVGMHAARPGTESGEEGVHLAGDWVRLPFPAMLMEAAHASGLLAANAILASLGLREELVEAVPQRGLLADAPVPPARGRWLAEMAEHQAAALAPRDSPRPAE